MRKQTVSNSTNCVAVVRIFSFLKKDIFKVFKKTLRRLISILTKVKILHVHSHN